MQDTKVDVPTGWSYIFKGIQTLKTSVKLLTIFHLNFQAQVSSQQNLLNIQSLNIKIKIIFSLFGKTFLAVWQVFIFNHLARSVPQN